MENFEITHGEQGFHVEGFPDAVKLIKLDDPKAKRLADLALHHADLIYADECLDALNTIPETQRVVRRAVWEASIVHFVKCFGGPSSRFQLSPKKVYGGEPPVATEVFRYFRDMRNKNVVHDENSYAQALPGAVLNAQTAACKIEKILCPSFLSDLLVQENYSNLKLLISKALLWVESQFDELCDVLTEELEAEEYSELVARQEATYSKPTLEDMSNARRT